MFEVFLKTLPFFGLIGLGWLASRIRFFPPEGAAWLTRFVFWFALSAMLFRFAAGLDLGAIFDPRFAAAYLLGSLAVWAVGMSVARWRGLSTPEAAMEAQCCMIGNTGFLGVPMLVVLLGEAAVGPVLMVLTIDTIVFSTLITLIVHASRSGGIRLRTLRPIARGIASNPMILSMAAGLAWAGRTCRCRARWTSSCRSWAPPRRRVRCSPSAPALRGCGWAGSLCRAGWARPSWCCTRWRSGSRRAPSGWIPSRRASWSPPPPLPVAGNVYILAQHFGLAEQRTSAAILISTAFGIATIPLVMSLIGS